MQEEVFGPVLTMMVFDSEAEAVQLANDSKYGLSAGIWTSDVDRPLRVWHGKSMLARFGSMIGRCSGVSFKMAPSRAAATGEWTVKLLSKIFWSTSISPSIPESFHNNLKRNHCGIPFSQGSESQDAKPGY